MVEEIVTRLSFGDEGSGRVVLRGHDLAGLAETHGYEEVMAILWDGVIPTSPSVAALGAARKRAAEAMATLRPVVSGRPAAQALRLLVACLSQGPGEIEAVAHIGVAAAYAMRAQAGLPWTTPDPARPHIDDLLALATGEPPDATAALALTRYAILMIDHGVSASTFTVRVVASTGGGLDAAMLAGVVAMEGARHGGAPSLVLDQMDEIAGPEDAARYVAQLRGHGRRVVGFGSRAYRGRDVRADLMRREWRKLGATGARHQAEAIEAALAAALARTQPERGLQANVEYYAALLLEATGLPRHGFTPFFAAVRAAGWAAHVAEQRQSNRLIRPTSKYVGDAPAR